MERFQKNESELPCFEEMKKKGGPKAVFFNITDYGSSEEPRQRCGTRVGVPARQRLSWFGSRTGTRSW